MASKEQKIRRNVRRSYVISTMSVALVLFMLGVVSYVALSMLSAASRLRDNVVVSVEIASEVEESQRKVLLQTIESTTMCHAVVFMSKDEKFADETFRQHPFYGGLVFHQFQGNSCIGTKLLDPQQQLLHGNDAFV